MYIKAMIMSCLLILVKTTLIAQNSISFRVLDASNQEPLVGATIYINPNLGAITDINGIAQLNGITEPSITVRISFIGFKTQIRDIEVAPNREQPIIILMSPDLEEMEEVIVTTTRASRSIEDIPTRIEFLGTEELEEKAVMRSDNIAMLLRESTGIQMQITSPSSANQSIRIQGLDGRYTQLLKDGFPMFGGFSGGLSIMQIPPLDLKQVEVIKGSNSTLYGGGAIAGLVNLVSIQPEREAKNRYMLDRTSAGGMTFNAFHAKRGDKFGMSLFATGNLQESFDPNDDNFSDIPKSRRVTVNPVFFYYPDQSSQIRLSLNGTFEDRLGGNLDAIESEQGSMNQFLQENLTNRLSYQLSYDKEWNGNRKLAIKNSWQNFDRTINQFGHSFEGDQWASFSEVSYTFGSQESSWVTGLNVYTDSFKEGSITISDRSYSQVTVGGFIQQVSKLSDRMSFESGLRLDRNDIYGWFLLPRFALAYKVNPKLTYRIGGGLGYKTPTPFTEDSERLSFRGISALNLTDLEAERSYGGNFDVNYRTAIGEDWTFSLNQLFFYTRLQDPIVLRRNLGTAGFFFENADGPVRSQGMETNLKLTYKDFKLFLNYAFIDTELQYDNINDQKPLTAKHNIGAVLVYERHGKWRIGLESYYTGRQMLSDGTQTTDFVIVGLMALRKFERFSLYLNLENFSDTRQSNLEPYNLGLNPDPESFEVWAPLEGFVVNGGIIIDLD